MASKLGKTTTWAASTAASLQQRGKEPLKAAFLPEKRSLSPTAVPTKGQGPQEPLEAAQKLGKVAPKWRRRGGKRREAQRSLQGTAAI